MNNEPGKDINIHISDRRQFLKKSGIVGLAAVGGLSILQLDSCMADNSEDVTPPEDLMREHGILNRVLLVYDHFRAMLVAGQDINPQWVYTAANIIKEFIEDYHEKQEEDFLFPRFEKANKMTDLVTVLREQHKRGRIITQGLLLTGKQIAIAGEKDKNQLNDLISAFTYMYRPHEAREDTVLFPALRSITNKHEFDSMGEDFEKREHQIFGKDGFELYVDKVAELEKKLGIYDLAQFTPTDPAPVNPI